MPKNSALQRATSALQRLPDPFRGMTSLLFVCAAHDASGADPTDEVPAAAEFNPVLRELEAACPDHLDGALVIDGIENVRQEDLAEALKHIRAVLARKDRDRDLFGMAFMEGQSLSSQQALGAFYTPTSVSQLIAQMNAPNPLDWVLEPACGTGSLLLAAMDQARQQHGPIVADSITYIGIELDRSSARLARMNMVLNGAARNSHIFCGDALTSPLMARNEAAGGELCPIAFDVVVANPPFGGKVRSLEPTEPFVIPDRLMNRPVPVPHADESAGVEDEQKAA